MADYHLQIARAVNELGESTVEARRRLYDRARTALLVSLRDIKPAVDEVEIAPGPGGNSDFKGQFDSADH